MPSECCWMDYVGTTEDCGEVGECYDGLYFSEEVGIGTTFYNIVVDTEDEFYSVEEFTMSVESEIVISLDVDLQLVADLEIEIVTDTDNSTSFSIVDVVQDGDIYNHTMIFNFAAGGGVFEKLQAIDGSGSFSSSVSGIKLPDGELVTFCTPLFFGISYS